MRNPVVAWYRWLHGRWPAGKPEPLPAVAADGSTRVPGLFVAGDLTGVPLLKFAADSGARIVEGFAADPAFARREERDGTTDVAILGAGIAGVAAALAAQRAGLAFVVIEPAEAFETIRNFPIGKPIFAEPEGFEPEGALRIEGTTRETLLASLRGQAEEAGIVPVSGRAERVRRAGDALAVELAEGGEVRAHRVVIAVGRAGDHRRLGVPGEDLDHVSNRLHDPGDFAGRRALVVGGGDTAVETAVALARAGSPTTLVHRAAALTRPKPGNLDALRRLESEGRVAVRLGTRVTAIEPDAARLSDAGGESTRCPADRVFVMIGREPPLDLFRRSGVPIRGERDARWWIGILAALLLCTWLYHWKSGLIPAWGVDPAAAWQALAGAVAPLREAIGERTTLLHTVVDSASKRSFWYTLAYCAAVTVFGIRRLRRRPTPYVRAQTTVLAAIQWLPLFLLPEIILPFVGRNGGFDGGAWGWIADQLFPAYAGAPTGEREYWRAYGLVLAWPLFVYNWFTDQPLWGWLALGSVQTFVIIPLIVLRWGKGAYCGWICSCGALAETMGDAHREKMPHGPGWNRLNMVGQVLLGAALLLLALRIAGWARPGSLADRAFVAGFASLPALNWKWLVDVVFAGILGVGLYFHFSGRVWCRFACPLAALMHLYARFTRFRILAAKERCISCNVCTSVCHQGIDVMAFASRGEPMADPQCVRCSACVQSCPTAVLSFGRVDPASGRVTATDRLAARVEPTLDGRRIAARG